MKADNQRLLASELSRLPARHGSLLCCAADRAGLPAAAVVVRHRVAQGLASRRLECDAAGCALRDMGVRACRAGAGKSGVREYLCDDCD